jgi:hypothetical protein
VSRLALSSRGTGRRRGGSTTTSLTTKRGRLFFERGRFGLRPTEAACLFYPEGCRNCRERPASALLDRFQFGTDRFGIVLGNVPNCLHRAVMEFTTTRRLVAVSPASGGRVADLLTRWSRVFRNVGPNWFASVMGTEIVATASALLPLQSHALHLLALGVRIGAAALLCLVSAATALHWTFHSANAGRHLLDAAMAPFFGAPPRAILTVGSGALLVGHSVLGMATAVRLDLALWLVAAARSQTLAYLKEAEATT